MVDLHPIGQLASCFQYQYFLGNNLGKSGRTNDIVYDLYTPPTMEHNWLAGCFQSVFKLLNLERTQTTHPLISQA